MIASVEPARKAMRAASFEASETFSTLMPAALSSPWSMMVASSQLPVPNASVATRIDGDAARPGPVAASDAAARRMERRDKRPDDKGIVGAMAEK